MDLRGIPMNGAVSTLQETITVESAVAGFTIGKNYTIYALVVDSDATLPKPKPYFVTVDDDDHFTVIDASKVKLA